MKIFIPALFTVLCAWPAYSSATITANASRGPAFTCTPKEFVLLKEGEGLRLRGILPTPAPGYGYDISEEEPGPDGSIHATLRLLAPVAPPKTHGGPAVGVSYLFRGEGDRLNISIQGGNLNGSDPTTIECHLAQVTP